MPIVGAGTRRVASNRSCSCPVVHLLLRARAGRGRASRSGAAGRGTAQRPPIGRHIARTFAFWASNSASVRMPCVFSSASSFSCVTVSFCGAAGGAGAYAVARIAVARTAAAVVVLLVLLLRPTVGLSAGDAVRHRGGRAGHDGGAGDAAKESGHVWSSDPISDPSRRATRRACPVGCSRRRRVALRPPRSACTKSVAHRFSKMRMPADEPGVDHRRGVVEVALVEQPREHAFEDGEVEAAVMVEVGQRERRASSRRRHA